MSKHSIVDLKSNSALLSIIVFVHFQMDLIPRGNPTHIPIPKRAVAISAGGHHSLVLTCDGEVYTFGNHAKGQLGREPTDEIQASSSSEMAARELWFAVPGPMPNIGSKFGRCATW